MSIFGRDKDRTSVLADDERREVESIAHSKAFHFYSEMLRSKNDAEVRMHERVAQCEKVVEGLMQHFGVERVWVEGHYEFRSTKEPKP